MVCFNLEVTFGFRLRNRGLWILPGLGALSILVLNGGSGDRFVLLDAALNGLLWWLIAVFIDRLIYRFRKRPAAKEVQQTLTCAVCGEELREKTQFCPHCGFTTDQVGETDVSRPEPSQGTTSPRADPAPYSQETRSVRQPKRPLLILIMVLGGLVLVGFVLLQFIRDPELPTTATAPTTTTNTVPSTTRAPSTTTPKASAVNTKTHKFQEGDTLYELASEHLGDGARWPEIAELNGISDPTNISNGTTIRIPDGSQRVATNTQAPSTTRAESATTSSCSLEDEGRDLVREWNRVSAELLAQYMDTSVTGDQYITASESLLPVLNRVVRDFRSLRSCLPAPERAMFEPVLGTYNDKFSGYSALETGVRIGSPAAQETALEILMDANARSVAMACEMAAIARASGQNLPWAELC